MEPIIDNTAAPSVECRALFALVSRVLAMLDRDGYPSDGICSHLGLNYACGDDNVGVTEHNGRLLIMIYRGDSKYQKKPNGDTDIVGWTKAEHEAKVRSVARAAGCAVHESWNGGEGHEGVSVCLARPCPAALNRAIANYRSLSNVFKMTDDERARWNRFHDWANVPSVAQSHDQKS